MAKTVKLPDGRVVTFPDSATQEQMQAAVSGMDQDVPLPEPDQGIATALSQPQQQAVGVPIQFGQGFNLALSKSLGLPVDAVNAALQQIGLGSDQPFGGSASIQSGLEDTGAITPGLEPQTTAERIARTAGGAVGTSVAPGGALIKGAQLVAPAARGTFAALAQQAPTAAAGAELTAALTSGVGEEIGREIAPGSDIAPIVGSVLGGVGPSFAQAGIKSVLQGGPKGAENITATLDSLRGVGIEDVPSIGVASQSRGAQAVESAINRLPFGGRIQEAAEKTANRLGKAVDNLTGPKELSADRAGAVIDRGLFGNVGFVKIFQDKASKLYGKLDELVPPSTPVAATNTRSTISELAGVVPGAERTSESLQSPFIKQISEAFLQDIDKGSIPYSALTQIRSNVGRKLSGGDIIADAPKAELKRLYAALSSDLEDAAKSVGPEATKAFNNANNFYKAGINRIDGQLKALSRKGITDSGIFRAATSGTNEGAGRLRAVFKSLNQGEKNIVSDTIVKRLGRATPGRQDDLGEVFSSETFLTNWNKLSNEAKDVIFSGRPKYRENLNQIADIASRLRESGRIGANPSGSAQGVAESTAIIGAPAALFADAGTGGVIVGALLANNATSRLMTNPRFVKWAAETSRLPIERLPGQIARLSMQDDIDETVSLEAFLEQLR